MREINWLRCQLTVFGRRLSVRIGHMKRLVSAAIMLMSATAASAQEHKISVQKYELPQYPTIARQAHIEGDVKLTLEMTADGSISSAKILSGHPMLTQTSLDAIRKWRFHWDDCAYGANFKHVFTFTFKQGEEMKPGEVIFQLPDRVIVRGATPVISY